MSLRDRVEAATSTPAPDADSEPSASRDIAVTDDKLDWLRQHGTYFTDALPRHVDKAHFIATARAILPKLANCTNESIITALLACARFGLEPDGKQAAIVPYKNMAKFQAMYQGYVDLMYRSRLVDSVHFNWINEADTWDFAPSAPPPGDFLHRPAVHLPRAERGRPILAYAFAWIRGGGRSQVILLNEEDAIHIRDEYSRAYRKAEKDGTRDSAWHTNFEDMWLKSCVLRLTKRVPTSAELRELIRFDEAADGRGEPPVIDVTPLPDSGDEAPTDTGTDTADGADWSETPQTTDGDAS
ncbi:recombinase RecT [Nocardiopsis sp. NPDC049922]|uniref:recombinase RecT n=1 Tax=Nocardiopsis sp. NPDC049922 TaxID=3155157 RepID=UPI0033F30CCE